MEIERLNNAINTVLAANDAFLVDVEVKPDNQISVFVDADGGIAVHQLKRINRQLEEALNRDEEDFALTVSSPGLDRPIKVHRQYINNVGRWLSVKLQTQTVVGKLLSVDQAQLTLQLEPKKKKEKAEVQTIALSDIVESKIEVRF